MLLVVYIACDQAHNVVMTKTKRWRLACIMSEHDLKQVFVLGKGAAAFMLLVHILNNSRECVGSKGYILVVRLDLVASLHKNMHSMTRTDDFLLPFVDGPFGVKVVAGLL